MSSRNLIFMLAALEVLAILPIASFPALMPDFIAIWGLSNTEAGWIAGIYYLGYMLVVTHAVMLTDRFDARLVFAAGAVLTGISTVGFAVLADGFWSGLLLRAIGGVGQAAVYMPGLRALTDRLQGGEQSRAVTFYTASYSIAVAASFSVTGLLAEWYGWRWSFAVVGLLSLAAGLLAWRILTPYQPSSAGKPATGFALRPCCATAMPWAISSAMPRMASNSPPCAPGSRRFWSSCWRATLRSPACCPAPPCSRRLSP